MKNNKDNELKKAKQTDSISESSKTIKKKVKSVKNVSIKPAETVETTTALSPAAVAKIEKKKAKKLKQKLKKQQKKLEAAQSTENGTTKTVEIQKVQPKNKNKNKKKIIDKAATQNESVTPKQSPEKKSKKTIKLEKLNYKKDAKPKERDPEIEAATVFVGNLPINTKRVQLVRIFKPFGEVKAIRLRTAGGKALFKHKMRKEAGSLNAYVVLDCAESATHALELNGTDFKGNHLRVTRSAKESKIAAESDAKRTILVGNLKYSANEEKLREIFSACGEIDYIRCLQDGEKGCKGVAYVCFKAPDAVGLALELNETLLDERPIHVERYSLKKQGAKEAREKSESTTKKGPKTGAPKRLEKKNKQQNGLKKHTPNDTDGSTKKKSEYRGVKVDINKKKQKKKKITSQMANLAKKIAPKPKSTD